MKRLAAGFAVALAAFVAAAPELSAVEQVPAPASNPTPPAEDYGVENAAHVRRLDADVWINKDEGGIYRPGESMRVYFRANADCFMLVYNIDTDGYIHLVYPYGPGDTPSVEGGRTYMIPSRSDPYDLVADGPPGIEYVVAVGSPYPFQNLPWYLSADHADGGRPEGDYADEDDTDSGRIVGDPYVGIDRILRRIAPPGREDLLATNETYFYIGRRVEYPRYVCADCHYHPYYFDPYVTACSAFDIRIDATWAHYAPIRVGTVRPRYIYRVRPQAPTRYRQWKQQWSSLDGRATLRTRFLPERDIRYRKEREPRVRSTPGRPEFRDLRRYREGRFWRGRDEILRLRERRDRVGPPPDAGARQRQEDGRGGRDMRDRERRPPEDRGYKDRERQRPPEDRGDSPKPPEQRGGRERERAKPPEEDRGTKERRPPDRQEDRGDRGDRGGRNREDRDKSDEGRRRDDRDRGDQGKKDRSDQDNGRYGGERPNRR